MTRPGAAARRQVVLASTRAHRLPAVRGQTGRELAVRDATVKDLAVRDEVAGTRRTLFLVFGLLVAMSGVAAFAIGGLITLRSDADEPGRLPAAPEQLAIMVGQLAAAPPRAEVPDPFEMMPQPTPSPTTPSGVFVPPIIGLTEEPDDDTSAPPEASGTGAATGGPTASPTNGCAPGTGATPLPTSGTGGSGGSVPVLPLSTLCP